MVIMSNAALMAVSTQKYFSRSSLDLRNAPPTIKLTEIPTRRSLEHQLDTIPDMYKAKRGTVARALNSESFHLHCLSCRLQ